MSEKGQKFEIEQNCCKSLQKFEKNTKFSDISSLFSQRTKNVAQWNFKHVKVENMYLFIVIAASDIFIDHSKTGAGGPL